MIALCQSCGHQGPMPALLQTKPAWCTCSDKVTSSCKGSGPGPYVAPPGVIGRFTFETKEASDFREQCRLASNAERQARDEAICTKWVRAGKGYRELPLSAPKRRIAEFAYRKAVRVLRKLQRECSHPSRSMFNEECCDVCFARVQSNVAQYRHLVRELGKREARRFVA